MWLRSHPSEGAHERSVRQFSSITVNRNRMVWTLGAATWYVIVLALKGRVTNSAHRITISYV